MLDGVDIVYIDRCRSASHGQREIDLNLHVGSRLPAYCTSMGKVLLADLDAGELEARLDSIELTKRGPNTITARARLLEELEQVRDRGLAVNNEELAYGLRSIAVPVHGQDGTRRRGDQPRRPPLARLDGGSRGAARPQAQGDGTRDLDPDRLPPGS